MLAGPLVALATFVAALIATHHVRVPFRDPDHVAALYLALVGAGVVVLAALDVAIRAGGPPLAGGVHMFGWVVFAVGGAANPMPLRGNFPVFWS